MAQLVIAGLAKIGVTGALGTALGQIGASILLSKLSQLLAGKPKPVDQSRELSIPTSLPAKRFAYGRDVLVGGTPAPGHVVIGNMGGSNLLFCCHILNSRPSTSISQVVIDKRNTSFTGDIYDFAGVGAVPASGAMVGHAKFWLGLGDQSGPPTEIMTEIGDATSVDAAKFWPTDRWTGCTVLWGRYTAGAPSTRAERWPSAPPEVGAIGNFTRVWDPRDGLQDPDDPTTWGVEDNGWLCILDCLRFNPLARWPLSMIDLASFIAAADEADLTRARLVGPAEPRWRIGGTVAFGAGSVLLDIIAPMVAAVGGDLLIDGDGIAAIPASARTPIMTVTDWLDEAPLVFRARQKSRDVPKAVRANWPQPEAKWASQTLTPAVVPGQTWAGGDDRVEDLPLDLVPFAAQAMQLQQIAARKKALGRELSFTAGPELFAHGVQAGDWLDVDFGTDLAARNGTYQVVEMQPGEWLASEDGVAFRQPVTLRETADSVFDWVAATDEQEVYIPTVAEYSLSLAPPSAVVAVAGVLAMGFTFTLSPGSATGHEWEYRINGGSWLAGGSIPVAAPAAGGVSPAAAGDDYEVRVRAVGAGTASAWVVSNLVVPTATAPRLSLDFAAGVYQIDGATVPQSTVLALIRASAATYIDSAGVVQTVAADVVRFDWREGAKALLVEPAATNLLLQSDDFSDAAWTKNGIASVAVSGTGPGTGDAYLLTESAVLNIHGVAQAVTITSGETVTVWAKAKAAPGSTRRLGISILPGASAATWVAARFDLATGAVLSTDAVGTGYALAGDGARSWALDDDWWLFALTGVAGTDTAVRTRISLASADAVYSSGGGGSHSYTGTTEAVLLAAAQFEAGAEVTSYIATTTGTVTRAADVASLQGLTALLDLNATYGDASDDTLAGQSVFPGYWPALTNTRIADIIGTI